MQRRVVFARHGAPDVLTTEQVRSAALGPGELRIEVAYAGVNFADVIARRGYYKWAPPLPTCVGFEVAGTVTEVARDVKRHAVGDRVLAITRFGGYADEVVVAAERAFAVPTEKSLAEAAALPAVSLTAFHSLCEVARVRPGESVLIQAVAGGVGLSALQLAKQLGLTTYGTASSPQKLTFAAQHGLDHGIDYARLDFEQELMRLTNGRGVDVVLDSLGGAALRKGYRCLAPAGRLVTIGAAQVAPLAGGARALLRAGKELLLGGVFHPFSLIEHNRSVSGVQILLLWDELDRVTRGLEQVISHWRAGVLRPHLDSIVPLERAAEAHARLESRKSQGKLLLRCAGREG